MKKIILVAMMTLVSTVALAQRYPGQPGRPGPGPGRPGPGQPPGQYQPAPGGPRTEIRDIVRAVGFDRRDCEYRLQNEVSRKEYSLIQSCQSQSKSQCQIVSRRFMGGGFIYPITGSNTVDEYKIDANTCRDRAAMRAEDEAVRSCQNEYGVRCFVTRRGVADHREERRRRYGLFGPHENFQICRGQAEAAPEGQFREQCSVEIIAASR